MSEQQREFKDIRKGGSSETEGALPVDEFMAGLEALQAEIATEKNVVWERVADGTLSLELLKRLAKEYYFLGVHYTKEFGSIVSNAPDTEALQMEASEHFHHWLQNLADETGFTGDHNHVDMKVDWAHELGVTDEELLTYRPMAETVGAVYTTLYYMRRSYEEGLAAFGWAGERFAASTAGSTSRAPCGAEPTRLQVAGRVSNTATAEPRRVCSGIRSCSQPLSVRRPAP